MDVNRILTELDSEIARLQQIRTALAGVTQSGVDAAPEAKRRGRPKGSKNAVSSAPEAKKRQLSPEGRKRIAEAMKKRWAERRKNVAK